MRGLKGESVMTYEKPKAEVIIFDDSDVITGNSANCGHQTSGKSCANNGIQKWDNCKKLNHQACPADLGI